MIIKVGNSFHLDKQWNIAKSKDNGLFYYKNGSFSSGSYTIESIDYSTKTNSTILSTSTQNFDTNTSNVFSLSVYLYRSGSTYNEDFINEETVEIYTNSTIFLPGSITYKTFPSSSIYPWNIISGSQP